jgi:hypothetical protein
MKSILSLLVLSFLFVQSLSAQWSVGARFGGATGVSLKHYPSSNGILFEGIAGLNFDENLDGFTGNLIS